MSNLLKTITGNKEIMNLAMKAIGAAMRGESPVDFMKNLALTNPKFQGYNFDDLEGTANTVCEEKSVDISTMKTEVVELANSYINKS